MDDALAPPDTLIPEETELRPAKINDRFLAYLIDTLPFVVGYHLCRAFLPGLPLPPWGLAAAWAGLYAFYQFLGNLSGGTPGKKLMGLGVVSVAGEPLGAGRSLARALGSLISTPLCNLGCLIALVHPQSRALHDLLAGTLVVENQERTAAESRALFVLAMLALIVLFGGMIFLTKAKPRPSDARAVARAQDGLTILGRIEESYRDGHGRYTASLEDLAATSGDQEEFDSAVLELFVPGSIELRAGDKRYRIAAKAKDRKRTPVVIEGP